MQSFSIKANEKQTETRPAESGPSVFPARAGLFTFLARREEQRIPFHICPGSSSITVAAAQQLPAVTAAQFLPWNHTAVHILSHAAPWVRAPFPSRTVMYSGNPSRLATRNAFYFYGDLVPKDKDCHPKGKLFCSVSACILVTRAETFVVVSPKLSRRTACGA